MNRKLALVLCAATAIAMPLSTTALAQADSTEQPAEHRPKLWVGDKAPELVVSDWIKGEPVEQFEKGKVYVVEFWATWCGPCIAGMPHLSEVQKRLGDKGVTIISVSSEDRSNTLEATRKMTKEKGDTMAYTVAFDAGRVANAAWMQPAEQRGIPASFVVDKEGKIAFIGHPMWLDIPLDAILAGTWEPKAGMKQVAEAEEMLMKAYRGGTPAERLEAFEAFEAKFPAVAHQGMFTDLKFNLLLQTERYADAWRMANDMVAEAIKKDDAMTLNSIAWTIVNPETEIPERDLPLALKAARSANAITGEKDAAILDTLARVYWWMGEKSHAVELQRKAVENAEGAMLQGVSKTLAEYEEAMKVGG